MLRGFTPLRLSGSLGYCEVQCKTLSLRHLVASLLGFQVAVIRSLPLEFIPVMRTLFPTTLFSNVHQIRRGSSKPLLLFGDQTSLPAWMSHYWTTNPCPHLFHVIDRTALGSIPCGWKFFCHTFKHVDSGGATDGSWVLGLLLWDVDLGAPPHSFHPMPCPWHPLDTVLAP